MAIVELFEKHAVHDIVEVNGDIHVITTVFDERTYQTMPLKNYIEAHTVIPAYGDYITIADFIENEINRICKEGHV